MSVRQDVDPTGLDAPRGERWGFDARSSALPETLTEQEARADQQAAVALLGREAHAVTLPELLDEAVRSVCRVLPCDIACVMKLAPSRDHLRLAAAAGALDQELASTLTAPIGAGSHTGWALQRREAVVCPDYDRETRFTATAPLRAAGMRSGVAVPIEGGVGQFGVLSAYARQPRIFSDDEIHFVQAVGTVLAAAFARETAQRLDRDLQIARRLDSIGQMAGGIAHDFNNLLGVILNYSQFALDELEPDSQPHHDITEAVRAARRAADLTRQLLVFSRNDTSAPEVVDVNGLVTDLSKLLQRTLGEHISLRLRLGEECPQVMINGAQFERVIVNLAVNARDAMPAGGALTIETAETRLTEPLPSAPDELPPGRYLRMTISDTGQGMAPEVAELAFEPFFTTKERGRGTGLGLATVYGLIAAAGGHVGLYSEVGLGTTVRIYLPTAVEEEAASRTPAAEAGPAGDGELVLVVEDEPGVRELAERILGAGGYRVLSVPGAAEALEALEAPADPVDLVITDVVMPGMSGGELAELIRSRRPELPIMFTSGYPGDVLSHQGLSRDGIPLLEKPFTADELLRAARDVLSSHCEVRP